MSDIDPTSPTWRAVQKHAAARLVELRKELETTGLSLPRTETLRGGISELSALLAIGVAPAVIVAPEVKY